MGQDEEKKERGRFRRNIAAIERYITILQPKLERQTGGMINMEELDKPESDPPLTPEALDLIVHPDNVHAANKLEPIFRDMGLSDDVTHNYMLTLLGVAGLRHGDPGAVRRWRARETEDAKLLARFFDRALKYVAEELERRHPGVEIQVSMDRDDEEAESKQDAAYQDRKWETEDSLRLLHRDWCILHYLHDYSSEAARYEVGEWHDVSPHKVRRAITHCNKELAKRCLLISRYYIDKNDETRWNEAV